MEEARPKQDIVSLFMEVSKSKKGEVEARTGGSLQADQSTLD